MDNINSNLGPSGEDIVDALLTADTMTSKGSNPGSERFSTATSKMVVVVAQADMLQSRQQGQ
jgi:hypothetical protein